MQINHRHIFYFLGFIVLFLSYVGIIQAKSNNDLIYLNPLQTYDKVSPKLCDKYDKCVPIAFLQPREQVASLLRTAGATVIAVGGNTIVVIPSRYLFIPGTADFTVSQPNLLNLTAKLAQQYKSSPIVVAGSTANIGSSQTQLKLSRAEANKVAHYLQHFDKLHDKPIATLALSSTKPIASEYTTMGRGDNNTIIISIGDAKELNYYRRFVLSPYQYQVNQ